MRFSAEELVHILVSVITISLAFSILGFADYWTVLFTLGLGFVLHELGHKFVAQHYGAWAEYRAWTLGLILALVTAIALSFVFAAPGAVYIHSVGRHLSKKQNGHIALAGAGVNFVLAVGFLAFGAAFPGHADAAMLGAYVNAFLGTFNLIPIHPLDGAKVRDWSNAAWLASFALLFALWLFVGFAMPAKTV